MAHYKPPIYIYNHCTKHLARTVFSSAHKYDIASVSTSLSQHIPEAWRFPIIDCYSENSGTGAYDFNEVTFVWCDYSKSSTDLTVELFGTFDKLYKAIPLKRVEKSMYYTVSLKIPKGEVHYYKFKVNGQVVLDPINPQRHTDEGDNEWSQFFTDMCNHLLTFEKWEADLLQKITQHILPFRTTNGKRFLDYYYHALSNSGKRTASRLDETVGVVNFIDKVLTREETYHLVDYRICLEVIDRLLRKRNPFIDPVEMGSEIYETLYDEMMSGQFIPDWDYSKFNNPQYFMELIRRHTFTGAFCHPRYGGNIGAAGWEYISESNKDAEGNTLFNWKLAIEQPFGENLEYIS
ncbi:gluconate 2-dehydrogenase subunit 3 family protein [Limibacter armeniacum]|uniref:gluconate 2-dehydrogenase subunit 3 family protein n=1 Tax=Limibacter armeniacum TaxID=466084 RepID=UPI002FE5757E